ncbi:MAG TPA: hydroxymethylglutaryl-CoA reductase [Candidatus Saccharimonadales bacterium]|nr:hydroxymethylglutaryl-CoA reductase [Candidatus Saccharimonadales bacterium]
MDLRTYPTIREKRTAVEKNLQVNLPNIGTFSLDEQHASTKNCENMIGAIQVPVGIAGPLTIKRATAAENFFLPLATTEGALVASINRGCKAITASGGVTVLSKKIGITRAPIFVVKNISEGQKFITWVQENFTAIKTLVEATSSHLTLLEIKPWSMGKNVFLRFQFDTEDAMGMNMATIATDTVVTFIEEQTTARCIALSGNMCVDKKPNFLNFVEGRGTSISADVVLSAEIVASILKTTVPAICEVAQRKLAYGSMLSGSIGANAQIANVLAALFLATGQDLGHIAECAMGITTVEQQDDDLYISVYVPDLVVGTVGGGTNLDTQKEALAILGIIGGNEGKNAQKLAEIMGGAVLAGELSLLASLAEHSLAKAHKTLGRGEK